MERISSFVCHLDMGGVSRMHGHPYSLQMVESIKLDFDLWRFYGIIQFYVDLRASEIKS